LRRTVRLFKKVRVRSRNGSIDLRPQTNRPQEQRQCNYQQME
jgi:hypothetical protein